MKDKILLFVIGVLVGSVISTGVFYVYTTANNNSNNNNFQMNGGTPPSMPNGQMGQPPSMPNNANNQTSTN